MSACSPPRTRASRTARSPRYSAGESTVRGWLRRERLTGSAAAKPHAGVARSPADAAGAPVLDALVERAGCMLLVLPPYSPDVAPIEAAWSKRRQLLRGIAARKVEALNAPLTTIVAAITADDARGYFRYCGDARQLEPRSARYVSGTAST